MGKKVNAKWRNGMEGKRGKGEYVKGKERRAGKKMGVPVVKECRRRT